jgi:hypothetical protein
MLPLFSVANLHFCLFHLLALFIRGRGSPVAGRPRPSAAPVNPVNFLSTSPLPRPPFFAILLLRLLLLFRLLFESAASFSLRTFFVSRPLYRGV